MVFAVVASNDPLPSYRDWAAQNRPIWKHTEGTLGEVWWKGSNLVDTLTAQGVIPGRGTEQDAIGGVRDMIRLSESLKQGKPTVVVGSIGFVVQKR